MSLSPMKFSRYQITVVAILAFLQFTVVLDFMILSPLGALLMKELAVTPSQFGRVVSAYAFAAAGSGLVAAGFSDKFDRKKLLLFFYSGFVLGTALCGIAPSYSSLLAARTVTGLFGGVIGSISLAIIADLFPYEVRGRVMGIVMSAFSASQVLGIPAGLYVSNAFGWHAPFLMIAAVSAAVGVAIFVQLRPIDEHLKRPSTRNAFRHLLTTVARPRYQWGFASTMFLAVGGFMLMPFGSAFAVHNLGIPLDKLPIVYMATGIATIVAGPVIGRVSDAVGKYATFAAGSALAIVLVVWYTRLGVTSIWFVIGLNIVLFVAITSRMVSSQALSSAIPEAQDRGAYMSISSSLQQLAGGVASSLAGLIVSQQGDGPLEHYERLGYVVSAAIVTTVVLMYRINRMVTGGSSPALAPVVVSESPPASS
jgi:predicted MFS family arabinose efflux permease